jgi:cyanophycin synthetase
MATGAAVLNARETMLVEMASLCIGEVIYFSLDPELLAVKEHRRHGTKGMGSKRGKRVVMVRDGEILLVNGANELPLAKLADIPFTDGGKAIPAVENILAAVAAAWALRITPAIIRTVIETSPLLRVDSADKVN